MLLGAIISLAACGSALPPLPSRGGPAWLELQSEHVTLWTDAPPAVARELIDSIERRRQVIARAMNRAAQRGRLFAIALRDAREMSAFLPSPFVAFAWPDTRNPSRQPGVVITADGDGAADDIVNHELAHAVSGSLVNSQPAWLAEGFATYFEMGDYEPASRSVEIGVPRKDRLVLLRQARTVAAAELFRCQALSCRSPEFYATSWALFSYLLNVHFDRFGVYLRRLDDAPASRHLAIWRQVFPELTDARLDRELSRWLASGRLARPRIAITPRRSPIAARKLGDADVQAVRALLFGMNGKVAASRAAVEAALALDRTHVLAWLVALAHHLPISAAEARAVAAAHPDDWRAQLLLRDAAPPGPEAAAAQERLCALRAREGNGCAARRLETP